MVRIIIHGFCGKMGQVLASVAEASPDIEIAAGVDPTALNEATPFPVFKKLEDCEIKADVIIDFSVPEAVTSLLEGAVQKKTALIIATTGHTEKDRALILKKAEVIPIFQAANMSLGINLMSDLIQKAAAVLGDRFDIEIIEKHHNLKKDAPSGTAYALADALNEVFLKSKNYVFGRHTRTERRTPKEIGIHAVRAGTIVGEHQVLFAGKDEALELKHTAYSKQILAAGAIQAARYIMGKAPGFYTMKDMITEQSTVTHLYTSDDEALISINHVPHDPKKIMAVFKSIGSERINLDMISQTAPIKNEVNISFTLPKKDVDRTVRIVRKYQKTMPDLMVDVVIDITKIAIEGVGMEQQSGVAAQLFEVMADLDISVRTVTTAETKIACIINQSDAGRAVDAVKKTFGI